jgi:hypothetical protein
MFSANALLAGKHYRYESTATPSSNQSCMVSNVGSTKRAFLRVCKARDRFWLARARWLAGTDLHLRLLSHFERVVYLDAEISNRAFKFRVAEQQLHRPQVLGASVNQRSLGATHGVCLVGCIIKSDRRNPAMYDACILPCRDMWRPVNSAGKQEIRRCQLRCLDPGLHALASRGSFPSVFKLKAMDNALHASNGTAATSAAPHVAFACPAPH